MAAAPPKHEVMFLQLEQESALHGPSLPEGVRALRWPGGYRGCGSLQDRLSLLPQYDRLLSETAPDLVHAGPVQSCGFMTAIVGFHPFLCMSWGSDVLVDSDRDDLWNWMTRYTLTRCDWFLCDCRTVAARAVELGALPGERIIEFPWGVDLQAFADASPRADLRRRPGWEDAFIILCTRAWEPLYRIDAVLEAFRKAYETDSSLRLVLAGGGSQAPIIRQYVERFGLQEVIHLPGKMPAAEMPGLFRTANLYISCASSDGTSVSLLEAMASGLPVVVTDWPSNREWVEEGQHGWLADDGDADAFAKAILTASQTSASDLVRIGQRNLQTVRARADWNRHSATLLMAYDLIQSRNRTSVAAR